MDIGLPPVMLRPVTPASAAGTVAEGCATIPYNFLRPSSPAHRWTASPPRHAKQAPVSLTPQRRARGPATSLHHHSSVNKVFEAVGGHGYHGRLGFLRRGEES